MERRHAAAGRSPAASRPRLRGHASPAGSRPPTGRHAAAGHASPAGSRRRLRGHASATSVIFPPPPPRVVLTVLSAWRNAGLAAALAVLTLLAGLAGPSDPAAAQTNNTAMGAPEVTGALRVSATLGVDTSGISDADGLTNPSFTYSWIRVAADDSESDLATGPAWTLRTEDEGTRIKVRVTFNDDLGTTESLTSAVTAPIAAAAKGTGVTQVQNTDRTADSTASALTVAAPGLAQAFTTGANVGGYTVNEVGVDFRTVAGTSTAGGELAATLHADDAGLPGDELCALTDPGSFNASGVHYFDAPRVGAGACVTLAASTTYHVVVNRSAFAGGSIEMGGTAATDEDTLALARGWTIADTRAALSSGSWASVASAGPLRIDVVAAAVNNATGEPVITGALRAGETLTADISGIGDPEGLTTSPQIIYNWRHDEFGGDVIHSFTTDSFTTSSTYTLTDDDLGKNIAVRVTFSDDLDNEESLISDATGAVAAAVPGEVLVANTGRSENHARALDATTSRRSQTFSTGPASGGYELESVGINFAGAPSTGDDVTVRLYISGSGALPGQAVGQPSLCTLVNPGVFTASGVQFFDAPSTGALCPTLAARTFYAFVIQRSATAGDIELWQTDSFDEDALTPATGWAVHNRSYTYDQGTWLSASGDPLYRPLMLDVRGDVAPSPAFGAPAVTGVLRAGAVLGVDTSDIDDYNGLTDPTFTYQWIRVTTDAETEVETDTDIAGATDSTYELAERRRGPQGQGAGHLRPTTTRPTRNSPATPATSSAPKRPPRA